MKLKNILLLLLLASIWGSSYILIKLVVPQIGVVLTMQARIIIAAVFLSALVLAQGKFPPFKKYWWQYIFIGLFNLVLPNLLVAFSIIRLNASLAAILNSATPLFTLLVSRIWLKEQLPSVKVFGLVLGMAGIVVLVGWNPVPFDRETILAFLASLTAAVCYAVANVFSRIRLSNSTPMQTASGQMLGASVVLLPFIIEDYNTYPPELFAPDIIAPLIILAVVSTALAFILYFKLVTAIGSVNTSLVTILVPVFGILWSILFLDESITWGILAALLFIVFGLALVVSPSDRIQRWLTFFRIKRTTKQVSEPPIIRYLYFSEKQNK